MFLRQSPQLTLDQFMAQSVGVWRPVCGEANYQTWIFNATDERHSDADLLPQKSQKCPAKYGYGSGVAEITAVALYKAGTTFVKIYQHWRGAKFEINDTKSWPVGEAELASVVNCFAGIRVVTSG